MLTQVWQLSKVFPKTIAFDRNDLLHILYYYTEYRKNVSNFRYT